MGRMFQNWLVCTDSSVSTEQRWQDLVLILEINHGLHGHAMHCFMESRRMTVQNPSATVFPDLDVLYMPLQNTPSFTRRSLCNLTAPIF